MGNDVISIIEKVVYTSGTVVFFWKMVDSIFGYLNKRQKEFISDVAGDMLKEELRPIKDAIAEIKRDQQKDNRFQHEQFQKILQELRKGD